MTTPTWHRTNLGSENLVGHNGNIIATVWRRKVDGSYIFRCGDLFAYRETFASAKAAAVHAWQSNAAWTTGRS